MPQRKCCVSSCKSARIEGALLHAFPNPMVYLDRFHTWVKNAGLEEEEDDYIYKNRRICHLHFEQIYHYPNNRLSRIAIPTLCVPGVPQEAENDGHVPMIIDDFQPIASTSSGFSSVPLETSSIDQSIHINPDYTQHIAKTSYSKSFSARPSLRYQSEIELYKTVAKTQYQLKRCQKAKTELKEKLKIAKKFTRSDAFQIVTKSLSPAAKTFFEMQIKQSGRRPKGHRFIMDEKVLALSLYKPSPKAYRLLSQICVLPKKSTLNKLMAKIFLSPGINDIIFDQLKKKVAKMPETHKYCTLLFDEMALAPHLSYDKQSDSIKGFCNDGSEVTKQFANHALVFMIRGIFKKFKQPICFSFCAGTTSSHSLKNQITTILRKVLETGLKVISVTCDQGPTNMAAINLLLRETKEKYIKNSKDYRGDFFEIDGSIIYPIYDPPHLMKGIRNNLITKNLEFIINGKKCTAKWTHLQALYKKGPGFKGLRLVPKLTARHVIPHLIPKMKVKFSTQVFSKTVSVAMGFTAGIGRLPAESTDTAELLLFFDRLFDSVNGNYSKVIKGKIYRAAVSPKSPHHKLWQKSLPILKSMKFVSERARVVPSISSWIKTIQSFQHISNKLHSVGLRSILLRNFNQDPLENFFGAIRAHGHRNIMPSTTAFEASFKTLLINNMVSPKSVGANCESDDSYCLQNLKYFFNQNIIRPQGEPMELDPEHFNIVLPSVDALISNEIPRDIEKCAAAAYCSGWVIKNIYKTISKTCQLCKDVLEGDSAEQVYEFISMKKNSNKSVLYYPSKEMLECMLQIEEITIEILKSKCESMEIVAYIELIATTLVSLNFIKCTEHKDEIQKNLLRKSILLILNDWCREVNNLLCGKSIEFDETDPIKLAAQNYYLKHKKRK